MDTVVTLHVARFWRVSGAVFAASGVAMGAVVAHYPTERFGLETGRTIAQSAVNMQMWHAVALLALGLGLRRPTRIAMLAGSGLVLGLTIFCGALYATAFSGVHFGSLAPTGGSILILSWALLAVAFVRHD